MKTPIIVLVLSFACFAQYVFVGFNKGNTCVSKQFTSNKGDCTSGCGGFTATMTVSYSGTTTAGSTLVAVLEKNSAPATSSPCGASNDCVSDTTNGNWTFECSDNNGGPGGAEIWIKQNAASLSSSIVITATANGNTNGLFFVYEATGVATSGVADGCSGNHGFSGSPISSGNFTSTNTCDLLFGWMSLSNGASGLGTNFTYTQLDTQLSGNLLVEYAQNSSSGTTSVQFVNNSSGTGTWEIVGIGLH